MTPTDHPDRPGAITRDRDGLLNALATIDVEGWEGPTATALLGFVRDQIARPLVIDVGLRGLAAPQAEASAWQAAWLVMTKPALRRAESPWGVVWQAARRAALGELVAARYVKVERRAWELRHPGGTAEPTRIPLSLDALLDTGWEPTDDELPDTALADLEVCSEFALTETGWSPAEASRIVAAVVELPDPATDPRGGALGWRHMATALDLPPWQARRLCVALRGTSTWPGLFARLLDDGVTAIRTPAMQAALRATRVRRHRSPALAAHRAEIAEQHDAHRSAS
jgi:hypothetical protein